MTDFSKLVTVNVDSLRAPREPMPPTGEIEKKTFSEIWERDARWLLGPGLLSDIIHFWMQPRWEFAQASDNPGDLSVSLALPLVRDEISGEPVSVFYAIPVELRDIFQNRRDLIYDARWDMMVWALTDFLYRPVTQHTKYSMASALTGAENEIKASGGPEIWQLAAQAFGFSPWALPKRANMIMEEAAL